AAPPLVGGRRGTPPPHRPLDRRPLDQRPDAGGGGGRPVLGGRGAGQGRPVAGFDPGLRPRGRARRRRPHRRPGRGHPVDPRSGRLPRRHDVAGQAAGSLSRTSAPPPARLAAVTCPPWAAAMAFVMARPRPIPPPLPGSRGKPGPSSATVTSTNVRSSTTQTRTSEAA